ncbi:CARDB domain-containing protein [Hyalangium rubrum]|uniref:CARDB domain-containing protein n=1 Tax=Hyalangium rubrum TaxID=3103134 RepID=A0ABU5H9H3_9BACT|nr:CARDB domain-containing protein [Hyalangium sp. s54d21]MDY7230147.1 CARDB domain-containing protein [Hyalangium sp. s54d21]
MKAQHRQRWLKPLLVAGGMLAGCGRGNVGPAELFLDSMLSAVTSSQAPDLWVSSVGGPLSTPAPTGYFVTVTACNQGTVGVSSTVSLYLSEDTRIAATDSLVGSAPTGMLHPQQCATLHVRTEGAVSGASGLLYVGALIDPGNTVEESTETNNSRAGTRMAIGSGADLTVAEVSAPVSLLPSGAFQTTATVCNTGTASASATVEVYLSDDAAFSPEDTRVGRAATRMLEGGQCAALAIPSTANVAEGSWYVAARVAGAPGVVDLVEGNDVRVGNRAVVGHGPDFTVSAVSGPSRLPEDPSETLSFNATVCNQGTESAAPQVEVYLSADSALSATDTRVGSASVETLEPGQCASVTVSGAPGVSSGLWYVAAWVDRAEGVRELLEDNNTRVGQRQSLGRGVDLVVAEVRGPASAVSAQPMKATTTVCNQGTASSPEASVALFLSLDASISTADPYLGSAQVPALGAGECAPLEVSGLVNVPSGSWYVGAYVDSAQGVVELSENNNLRAGNVLGVGDGADLVVSRVTGPDKLQGGQPVTGQATVCNQGTQPGRAGARVGLYLSRDAAIIASDMLLGEVVLPTVGVGQCVAVSVPGGVQVPEGTWYLGAIADLSGEEVELIEDNNILAGGTLTVGNALDATLAAAHSPRPSSRVSGAHNQDT